MGMFDKYNVFPTLKTKRVVIAPDPDGEGSAGPTVTVTGLLSTKKSRKTQTTWLGTNKFTQYVKVCFAVVPDHVNETPEFARIYNADTRFGDSQSFTQFERTYATACISLDEIMQNDYASSTSETDLEAGMEVNSLSFNLDIDMNQGNSEYWDPNKKWLRNDSDGFNSWILVGFIHFDYEKFQENYRPVDNLKKLGGNTTIDTLLKKSTGAAGSGTMKVPETVKAYFYAESWPPGSLQTDLDGDGTTDAGAVEAFFGEPYYGLVHYHEGPDRNGQEYSGWMGGRMSDPEMGPKLSTRTIRYTKVVANHTIQAPVNGLRSERYNGAQGWFYNSYDDRTPNINYNPSFEKRLSNLSARVELLGANAVKTARQFRNQIMYKNKISNSNILFAGSASGIKVDPVPRAAAPDIIDEVGDIANRIANTSCHQLVGFMDIKEVLSLHSPLGWLVEYHADGDASIIQGFMDESEIKHLQVSRVRLSNHAEGNVATSTSDYIRYDNDEIPKVLVTTSDVIGSAGSLTLKAAGKNDLARIAGLGQAGFARGFYLEDYDLFHNVTYGNYEYSADVSMIDGIKKSLEAKVNTYYKERKSIQEYIQEANIPVTYKDQVPGSPSATTLIYLQSIGADTRDNYATRLLGGFSEEEESKKTMDVVYGNYDYKRNEFTEKFKTEIAPTYEESIRNFLLAFVECYKILDKIPAQSSDWSWEEYITIISYQFFYPYPGMMEKVLVFTDSVAATLDRILGRENVGKYERMTSALPESSLDTSKENRLINVKARIPELVQAFSRTQIFYEPDTAAYRQENSVFTRRDRFNLQME